MLRQTRHIHRFFRISSVLLALLGSIFFAGTAGAIPQRGEPVPGFTLSDLTGTQSRLPQDAEGKVLVLHFWGSTCSYCRDEILILKKLLEEFDNELYAASINVGESPSVVNRFIAKLEPQHPILLDEKSLVAREYGVWGIPVTFIADRDGVMKFRIFGEINESGLRKLLDALGLKS